MIWHLQAKKIKSLPCGQRTAQGTGKVDWQEVFFDGTGPPAQADTREEVGNKKSLSLSINGRIQCKCKLWEIKNYVLPGNDDFR